MPPKLVMANYNKTRIEAHIFGCRLVQKKKQTSLTYRQAAHRSDDAAGAVR